MENNQSYIIKGAQLVNEGKIYEADVLIENERISQIGNSIDKKGANIINAEGMYLLPGVIDDQVHFREPGLTYKAEIETESQAAVAGGVTSFMEMPNTKPPTLTQDLLEAKYHRASQVSPANYSFFMGVSNDNLDEVLKTNEKANDVAGIKIFMGSSTGNMLVDDQNTLEEIFKNSGLLIATHCEDESIIHKNLEEMKSKLPEEEWTAKLHPVVRSEQACYASSSFAVDLAKKFDTRLHILHISTAIELDLFDNKQELKDKKISSEVCVHHLTFSADDYDSLGNKIKCNPAIKTSANRDALWEGLLDNRLDIIATDHAPHTAEEKNQKYYKAPAGVPLVQHSLLLMLEHSKTGKIPLERVVEKMSHAPAICFQVKDRGFIREGYYADLVLVNPKKDYRVTKNNILYKCDWSPFEGDDFGHEIHKTFVNGHIVYENQEVNTSIKGKRLEFDRI